MCDENALFKSMGERMRKARETLALTQKNIAMKAGLTIRGYLNYEQGTRGIPPHLLNVYSILGVNINWLLTGEGSMFLSDHQLPQAPMNVETTEAINALREDILAQKIVIMLQEVDEEDRREILALAEKAKQAKEEKSRLLELEAKVEELEGRMGKAVG